VTHDQAEAMAMSDRIVVMYGGAIQQIGRPMQIYEEPANRVVADFIGLVNFIDAVVEENTAAVHGLSFAVENPEGLCGETIVAVRPENIEISREALPGSVPGELIHKVYLGDAVDYRVQVAGDKEIRVISKTTHFEEFATGGNVHVAFSKLLLFKKA
jgi:iron(III) transport system ATP-binding protein